VIKKTVNISDLQSDGSIKEHREEDPEDRLDKLQGEELQREYERIYNKSNNIGDQDYDFETAADKIQFRSRTFRFETGDIDGEEQAYMDLMNRLLKDPRCALVEGFPERTWSKSGERLIHVEWMEASDDSLEVMHKRQPGKVDDAFS